MSVVTHVDPAEMGIVVPTVEKVPAENTEKVTEGGEAVTEGSGDIPMENEEVELRGGTEASEEEAVEEAVTGEETSYSVSD